MNIDCPICGTANKLPLTPGTRNSRFDTTCLRCKNDFEVQVRAHKNNRDWYFVGVQIQFIPCEKCGKETRFPYRKGVQPVFPKSIEEHIVCAECVVVGLKIDLGIA